MVEGLAFPGIRNPPNRGESPSDRIRPRKLGPKSHCWDDRIQWKKVAPPKLVSYLDRRLSSPNLTVQTFQERPA
jgi:hypothetical protein